MQIQVNGESRTVESAITLVDLLAQLGFANKPVAVELNKEALTPSQIKEAILGENDQLEIIVLAPGG